ncbi:Tol-Pal system peptidoglycan-associated lipoprotein PAL [hydrothermal vent metagenome]|uniref:Tol-Pal system peptidoglycan-associated lipoprotein PAL n=1 Tax=hydrothermal vent metagenome TaxID=652676 RepID=A0A3B0Z943_9ZZZZ
MNILRKALILVVPVMFLVGCASAPIDTTDDTLTDSASGLNDSSMDDHSGSIAGGNDDAAQITGIQDDSSIGRNELTLSDKSPSNLLNTRVIYFDFDRSKVRAEFTDVIAAHAEYLANNPGAQMKLEGHADERGSREYNIGLGERRGNSIARHFGLQGASRGQLEVVSYGEERPAAMGHDETSWELNRRVEIIYTREQ